MDRTSRVIATTVTGVVAFIAAFVFIIPSGCDDRGGVPSWERCSSMMGTPAISLSEDLGLPFPADLIIPLALAGGLAALVWWATGLGGQDREDPEPRSQR
ncbi:MAG TPA: hypothetical protein VFS66_14315 [Acidimicrobiia bacterium]|nr:hypothetical protein [Acidimicrobiia bacterium]